ncbi:hypothetical protein DPMN_042902 [Dreissena polymorpha]|uniref:Zinc finger PHD-type domain-containing protein n=1 Tax=Dreissena polymorpha TaxID=45954 RepID=A0A9D4D1V2_DREPO|nr:hypothetical protein DPMN_042902 [Dreissena polymorpha]
MNGNAHYNCIGALNNHITHCDINNEPSVIPNLSPEHVRPHPKAPPRKGKIGPRKRKTAILTDTPEKNAIEDALRRREQRKNKPTSKRPDTTKSVTKAKQKKKKPIKRKYDDIDSSDEEDCYCLICVEPYSNSRSREKWIQCVACKYWAHEECTAVSKGHVFVCQNCESDDDSDDD